MIKEKMQICRDFLQRRPKTVMTCLKACTFAGIPTKQSHIPPKTALLQEFPGLAANGSNLTPSVRFFRRRKGYLHLKIQGKVNATIAAQTP
jgi:hypothetical protein